MSFGSKFIPFVNPNISLKVVKAAWGFIFHVRESHLALPLILPGTKTSSTGRAPTSSTLSLGHCQSTIRFTLWLERSRTAGVECTLYKSDPAWDNLSVLSMPNVPRFSTTEWSLNYIACLDNRPVGDGHVLGKVFWLYIQRQESGPSSYIFGQWYRPHTQCTRNLPSRYGALVRAILTKTLWKARYFKIQWKPWSR